MRTLPVPRTVGQQADNKEAVMGTTTTYVQSAHRELSSRFDGELIGPTDPLYDEARAVFNAWIDRRPALIARCANDDDVANAIAFARRHDLPIAVRGGGHNGGRPGRRRRRCRV